MPPRQLRHAPRQFQIYQLHITSTTMNAYTPEGLPVVGRDTIEHYFRDLSDELSSQTGLPHPVEELERMLQGNPHLAGFLFCSMQVLREIGAGEQAVHFYVLGFRHTYELLRRQAASIQGGRFCQTVSSN